MSQNSPPPRVQIDLTLEQADAVRAALDLLNRASLGQLEQIADLMRCETIRRRSGDDAHPVGVDIIEHAEDLLGEIKHLIGHHRNGSFGIGHPGVPAIGKRAYEVKKAIDKAVSDYRRPGKRMTVDHDGLIVRYTQDPAPEVRIITD